MLNSQFRILILGETIFLVLINRAYSASCVYNAATERSIRQFEIRARRREASDEESISRFNSSSCMVAVDTRRCPGSKRFSEGVESAADGGRASGPAGNMELRNHYAHGTTS